MTNIKTVFVLDFLKQLTKTVIFFSLCETLLHFDVSFSIKKGLIMVTFSDFFLSKDQIFSGSRQLTDSPDLQQYSRPADKLLLIHVVALQFCTQRLAFSLQTTSRSTVPQIICGELGKCFTINSKHLLMHILVPVAEHGNCISVSWVSTGCPFGCSLEFFLNCPLKNTAQEQ